MTTVVLYHDQCLDGISSAWVASKAYPETKDFIACQYNDDWIEFLRELRKRVKSYDTLPTLLILDFSFKSEQMLALRELGFEIKVIDHHKTAWQELSQLDSWLDFNYNVEECGATLTWRTLFPELEMPAFLDYVKDRDIWIKALPYTEEINLALWTYYNRDNPQETLSKLDELKDLDHKQLLNFLLPLGEDLLKQRVEKDVRLANQQRFITVLGYHHIPTVYVYTEEDFRHRSDVCQILYKAYPECPFSACVLFKEGEEIWALRSDQSKKEAFDVAELAKTVGGGGHKGAAGYTLKIDREEAVE